MTVRQMASVVHGRLAPTRTMAVLKAYFDESGFEGPVFTLCGFVATEAQWEKFDEQWRKLLASPCCFEVSNLKAHAAAKVCAPLDYLHAQEMEKLGVGRFRRIGQRNRNYLIRGSVDLILSSGILGVASGVVIKDYKEHLSERGKKLVVSPYLLCMQWAIMEISRMSAAFMGETENIAYVFERQEVWAQEAHRLFDDLRKDYQDKYRMGTLTFADKHEFTPLQAADVLRAHVEDLWEERQWP